MYTLYTFVFPYVHLDEGLSKPDLPPDESQERCCPAAPCIWGITLANFLSLHGSIPGQVWTFSDEDGGWLGWEASGKK